MRYAISIILILTLLPYTSVSANSLNDKIIKVWGKENWNILINECKKARISEDHCKILASSIAKAESNNGKNAYKHNIFWINNWKVFYSDEESIKDWVIRYNKYWYKLKYQPKHFYSNNPKYPALTRYCMSEESSNSKGFCPNWRKHADSMYNYLTK